MRKVIANECPHVYLIRHTYRAENVECPIGGPYNALIETSYTPGQELVDFNTYESQLTAVLSLSPLLIEEAAEAALNVFKDLAGVDTVSVKLTTHSRSHGAVIVYAGDFVTRILEEPDE